MEDTETQLEAASASNNWTHTTHFLVDVESLSELQKILGTSTRIKVITDHLLACWARI